MCAIPGKDLSMIKGNRFTPLSISSSFSKFYVNFLELKCSSHACFWLYGDDKYHHQTSTVAQEIKFMIEKGQ